MDYVCVFKKSIIAILILITFIVIFKLSVFYMPFLIAYIISLIIDPLIKWIKRKTNFTRKTSSIIVLATIFSIFISIIIYGIISLIIDTTYFLSDFNLYLEKIVSFI